MKKFLFIVFLTTGCATDIKSVYRVTQTEASFDGNVKDSGIKEYREGVGFIVSENAVKRYTDLCNKFNYEAIGISNINGEHIITKQGIVRFLELTDKNLQ